MGMEDTGRADGTDQAAPAGELVHGYLEVGQRLPEVVATNR